MDRQSWDNVQRGLGQVEQGFDAVNRVIARPFNRIMIMITTWWATLLVVAGLALVFLGGSQLFDALRTHCSAAAVNCPGGGTPADLRHDRIQALELLGVGVLVVALGCVLYLRWFRPSYWRARFEDAVDIPVNRAIDHAMDRAVDGTIEGIRRRTGGEQRSDRW